LHVTYDMNIGGTEQVICQLIAGSSEQQFCHFLACTDGTTGPMLAHIEKHLSGSTILERSPGFDVSLMRSLRAYIRANRIDVVHAHQYTPFSYAVFACLGTDAALVFTEHGRFFPDSFSWKRRLLNPFLQFRCTAITAISAATADALVQYEWFRRQRIQVVYNGLAEPQFNPKAVVLKQSPDEIVFGTVCRFDSIKNLPLLIKAFADFKNRVPASRLILVGDGPENDRLRKLVSDLSLQSSVDFTGFQDNPSDYMSHFDVFVLPSFSEGTSMTLLAAMALGKSSIVTAVGGNTELITDGHSGAVVPSDSQSDLLCAMVDLASSEVKRAMMGVNARQDYLSRFSQESMGNAYETLYRSA